MSATGHTGTSSTEQRGEGGYVTRQQLPFSGLSAVETFPATAVDIQLAPNPLLIDGNTTATAGINVGFGPTESGDRDARHVGAGFADAVTPVNTIYVWLDRSLPPAVGSALVGSMAVYRSDDNRNWTPVAVVSPPVMSQFANRIEVTIAQTQASYLKVTLLPLAVGVTTDAAYRELFVTEIQLLLVLPASQVPSRQMLRGASRDGHVARHAPAEPGPDLGPDGLGRAGVRKADDVRARERPDAVAQGDAAPSSRTRAARGWTRTSGSSTRGSGSGAPGSSGGRCRPPTAP